MQNMNHLLGIMDSPAQGQGPSVGAGMPQLGGGADQAQADFNALNAGGMPQPQQRAPQTIGAAAPTNIQNGRVWSSSPGSTPTRSQVVDKATSGGGDMGSIAGLAGGAGGAGAAAGGGSSMAALAPMLAMMSDENMKENIEDGGESMEEFLDNLNPAEYDYKEPEQDGEGKHYSVMAQDLEKSKAGKAMIHETPRGKMVDYGKGMATNLAATAHLNKKLKNIESLLAKMES